MRLVKCVFLPKARRKTVRQKNSKTEKMQNLKMGKQQGLDENFCRLWFCRIQLQPHDWPSCRSPGHFMKTGFAKRRGQSSPDEGIREGFLPWFDRIAFQEVSALSSGMSGRCAQQLSAEALSPRRPGYKQAGYGPDRLPVHPRQRPRVLQQRIAFSWANGAPSCGFIADVGKHARFCARSYDSPEGRSIFCSFARFELFASQPPPHAPAPCASAAFAKQVLQLFPPFSRQWFKG